MLAPSSHGGAPGLHGRSLSDRLTCSTTSGLRNFSIQKDCSYMSISLGGKSWFVLLRISWNVWN
jgi:hypothetical protein